MFENKKQSLVTVTNKTSGKNTSNQFLFGAAKEAARTKSGNNAEKFLTTGSDFVDQFGKLGTYKSPRQYNQIAKDCDILYSQNKELFVKFMVYIRMISRKTNIYTLGITTKNPQSGAELKHEGIMRMLWLSQKDPNVFWENVGLFISTGSCKDIFTMLRYDLVYHGWEGRVLDWNKFGELVLTLLSLDSANNLVKKYLPQIKSNSQCTTVEAQANNMIAKWICSLLFGSKDGQSDSSKYKRYRQLKNSGNAHEWQKLISQKRFNEIDFKKIHGRALNLLVKSKFLKNQNLQDVYTGWVTKQETIKYTGFVHELLCELDSNNDKNFELTVEKQFKELVVKMKNSDENFTKFIVVRDTSGSMGSVATGTKFSSNQIAKSLALYFSEFLTGDFAQHWIEFNNTAKLHQWKGSNVVQKWRNDNASYVGSTNFQSVIDLFVQMKKNRVPESDFPQGILCISDGEFNPAQLGKTNVDLAKEKLANAGFSKDYLEKFKIVLWNIPNAYYGQVKPKFETFGDVKNVFYLSGYSASNVQFILNNKVETAEDLFNAAMSQELLNLIQI